MPRVELISEVRVQFLPEGGMWQLIIRLHDGKLWRNCHIDAAAANRLCHVAVVEATAPHACQSAVDGR